MILELFLVLLLLSFFLVWLGFRFEDNGYCIVGFFFIFLLSLILIANSLSYQTGSTVTTINSTVLNVVNNYTAYADSSSHWIGYFLAIASSVGMITSWMYPNVGNIRR